MRAFVAIELPVAVREALESRIEAARTVLPPGRWVPARSYHLTLVFLGEIQVSQATALGARLQAVFRRHAVLNLRLEGGDCFPPRRSARVVWVGVSAPPELFDLRAEVEGVCRRVVGLEPERRAFRPHLTVARCRRPWPVGAARRWRQEIDGPSGPTFAVREGVLLESRLEPAGVVYRRRARWPLAEAR